jgi:hypothetical protein
VPHPARIFSALAVIVAAAGLTVALLAVGIPRGVPSPLTGPIADGGWTARTRGWFTPRGFYGAEVDTTQARAFSWTSGHAELFVPAIDRSAAYRIAFRVAAGRGPATAPPPALAISIDGIVRQQAQTSNDAKTIVVETPVGPQRTLWVALDFSNTFVPGPQDTRPLGVVIDQVTIEPLSGQFHAIPAVSWRVALATAGYVVAALFCGIMALPALLIGVAVAAAHVWLLALDGAFMGTLVDRLLMISGGVTAVGVVVGIARWRWPARLAAPEWAAATGVILLGGAMKLAFFSHPRATIGD